MTPTRLAPKSDVYKEAERSAKLRVYATAQYRAQNLHWRERFNDDVDMVNQYLIPAFGLRLEVVEYRNWDGVEDRPEVSDMVALLEALDPGDDVDWVVGLTSALSSATTSFHRIGAARPLGRHWVMRGFEDLDVEARLAKVEEQDRKWLREARRQHRQVSVFMHEWAHSLGVNHVTLKDTVMAAGYSRKISGYSSQVESLVRAMLRVRMVPPDERSMLIEARAWRAHMRANPWEGWQQREVVQTMDWVDEMEAEAASAAGADEPGGGSSGALEGIPKEVAPAFERVNALAREGRHSDARAELEPLIAAYPAHVAFRLAGCQIRLAEEGPSEAARADCGRVAELDPEQTAAELMLARALVEADQRADAGAVLAGVLARIPSMTRDAAGAWTQLVSVYRGLNAVTWLEDAILVAPEGVDTEALDAWTHEVRRRHGLPPDSARKHRIPPEEEGAYLATVRSLLQKVYTGDYAAAGREGRAALARYPRAPGVLGALCDLELRRKRYAAARAHCQRAVDGYPDATWARYLLGILDLRARKNAAGIRHLEHTIEVDPGLRQAYHALYKAYGRMHDSAAQERLDQAYRAYFGVGIPR
ncbi:hypothetical protein [Haliangium sp.]